MHKPQIKSPPTGDTSTSVRDNNWSILNEEADKTVIRHFQGEPENKFVDVNIDQNSLSSDLSIFEKSLGTIHKTYVRSPSNFNNAAFPDYSANSSPSLRSFSLNSNARFSNSMASSTLTTPELVESASFPAHKYSTPTYPSRIRNRLRKNIREHELSPFSRQIVTFLHNYSTEERILRDKIESSLDRFKFAVVASNQMHSNSGAGTSCEDVKRCEELKAPFTTFTIDLYSIPYYPLVHSLKPAILSVALFFYIVRNRRFISGANLRISVLLCLYILSVNLNTRRIAIAVYLQMLNNRISQFLNASDTFDTTVLQILRSHGSSKSSARKNTLQRLYGAKKQPVRRSASDFQLKNSLSTVILSLNSRLVKLLPLIDDYSQLSKYLQLYNANLDDQAGQFIKLLNHQSSSCGTAQALERSHLKPLRLRSFNCGELLFGDMYSPKNSLGSPFSPSGELHRSKREEPVSPDLTKDSFSGIWAAQSSPRQKSSFGFPRRSSLIRSPSEVSANTEHSTEQTSQEEDCLSGQPSKLMRQLCLLRKIYLCSLLSFVITSKPQLGDSADSIALFRTRCIKRFGLDEGRFRHMSTVSRVFLAVKLLEQARNLLQCISDELRDNDEFVHSEIQDENETAKESLGFGSFSGTDNTILEEDEEDEHTERLSELDNLLDSLSVKIGALKTNKNLLNQQRRLAELQEEFHRAVQTYSKCCEDFVRPEKMAREFSEGGFPGIGKRHSRGLSIGLLAIAKSGEQDENGV